MENKELGSVSRNTGLPMSLSLTLVESPSGARNPPCLLIMPGLLRSDRGGASVSPLLRENGSTPAAYVSGANFLS